MESSRNTSFPERVRTRIWQEEADEANPWLSRGARCHGYAHADLVRAASFPDMIFLLLRGELPAAHQRKLLDRLLLSFCNPGPRHVATRAVMNAAASGTRDASLGAIALALLGGEHLGSAEVEQAATFIATRRLEDPRALAARLLAKEGIEARADRRPAPGFGTLHGDIDPFSAALAAPLLELASPDGPLTWASEFASALSAAGCGWLPPAVAAAGALELGFGPRSAGALFQIASLPGLLAHALEVAGKGITAMPFVPESRYEYLGEPESMP